MNHRRSQPRLLWRGLTLQIFLFTILPLTILLLVISFGSLTLHHNSMRALVGDRDLRAVRSAANSFGHEIEHRALALQLFAQQLDGSQDADGLLESTALPGFEGGLALVSSSNRLLAGSIQGLEDVPEHLPPPAPNVAFSKPVRGETGEWLVLAAVPTPGGSRLVGAFYPADLARNALAGVATPQTTILLLSAQGQVLYQFGDYDHSRPLEEHIGFAEVLRGESGVNYSTDHEIQTGLEFLQGESESEHLVAFTPVPPLGWGLVLEESWEEIASPLLRLTQSAPLVLVPVLILALLALWFVARQVVQPLQALESRAARLASGDFAAIRAPVGGISEIRHLQGTLVDMARDLQAAQESLHGYIGALTAGIENERRSLARELHDDTLQALIALNQQVQLAQLQLSTLRAGQSDTDIATDTQQRQSLLDLQKQVAQTITNLRRAIGGLRPIYLEDLGLSAALGMLVKEVEAASNRASDRLGDRPSDRHSDQADDRPAVQITLDITGVERRLPGETELALYRIAQEALNNAVHHSQARRVEVTLQFASPSGDPASGEPVTGDVQLTICDDGDGFSVPTDSNAFARKGHYGLLSMRERADLAGADFDIVSAPGKGTTIKVKCVC